MATAFERFRSQYPQGCLVSDLITIQDGQYVVRTAALNEGTTLATGMAASVDVQIAEDRARERAIALLGITTTTPIAPTSLEPLNSVDSAPAPAKQPPATQTPTKEPQPKQAKPKQAQATKTQAAPSLSIVQPTVDKGAVPNNAVSNEASQSPLAPPEIPLEETPIESEEDLGPPIDVIEESTEPIDESLEAEAAPEKVSAATIALENFNASAQPVDLSDVIAQTDVELTRLGWTSAQGREYLTQTYGKRSRQQLTDEELMSFLLYLEEQ